MPENSWNKPNFWLSVITLKTLRSELLIGELEKENIEARPIWKPMHLQPLYENYEFIGGKVAESLFNTGVCLPSDTKLEIEDLERVVETIRRVISHEN